MYSLLEYLMCLLNVGGEFLRVQFLAENPQPVEKLLSRRDDPHPEPDDPVRKALEGDLGVAEGLGRQHQLARNRHPVQGEEVAGLELAEIVLYPLQL